MPRVETKTKFNMGSEYKCGRYGRTIAPGDKYFSWKFRYGGKRVRCAEHYPRPSELTQSKMSGVYSAIETAQDSLPSAESIEDIKALVEECAGEVQQVAEEYREAAEAMGGAGYEMEEKADELESWVSDLEDFDPDEPDDDEDSDGDAAQASIDQARSEAEELLGGCPL